MVFEKQFRRRVGYGVAIQSIGAVEIGQIAGLAEPIEPERAHLLTANAASAPGAGGINPISTLQRVFFSPVIGLPMVEAPAHHRCQLVDDGGDGTGEARFASCRMPA